MSFAPRLDILRQLREAQKLSQADMARLCGLHGKRSQQTAGAWERGEMIPSKVRRARMIGYLWDSLRLGDAPAQFEAVWDVLVEAWQWEPISDREWRSFTHKERPLSPDEVDQQLTRLEDALDQVQVFASRFEAVPLVDTTPRLELHTDKLPNLAPLPPGSLMPLSRNPFFVGRDEDLLTLAAALSERQTAAISPVETAAATGLGGIGKTQLASEFVHRYGQFFPGGVFWLSFENASAIPAAIAACGGGGAMELRPDFATHSLEEQVRLVQSAWQEETPRLLVFDNCEDPSLLARWRPNGGGCRILVTSRRGEWEPILNVGVFPIGVLARQASLELLRHHCPNAASAILEAIAAELGDLPLALHLAGSYLYRYRRAIAPAQYLAQLRDPRLLQHPSFQGASISPTEHVQHVGRTFALSFDRLHTDEVRDGLARQLLVHMAQFVPGEPVWYDVLVRSLGLDPAQPQEAVRAEDAFARLIELGLIQVEDEKGMRIHRLVAVFVQEILPEEAAFSQRTIEEEIYANLCRANDGVAPLTLLPGELHMRHVVEAALRRDAVWGATMMAALGRHVFQNGDYQGARELCEITLDVRRQHLGEEHVDTAESYSHLGGLLRELGDIEASRLCLEKALDLRLRLLGEDHIDTVDTLSELGVIYIIQRKLELAVSSLEQALRISRSVSPPDQVAEIANNLGMCMKQGLEDPERALPYLEEALSVRQSVLGELHPYTAIVQQNLGMTWLDLNQFEKAEAAFRQAYTTRQQLLGEEHPNTAYSLCFLGSVLARRQETQQGYEYMQQALTTSLNSVGDGHLLTAICNTHLGIYEHEQSNLGQSFNYLMRALLIRENYYQDEHPAIGETLELLAVVEAAQNKVEDARNHLTRALRIYTRLMGMEHKHTQKIASMLNSLLST